MGQDIHKEEVDVWTVTVNNDDEHNFEEALLNAGQIGPVLEARVHTAYRQEKLDNTLRPDELLSETMTLEEATRWLRTFDSYLSWNASIIERKSIK